MTFEATSDQLELRDGLRRYCAGRVPIERVRAQADAFDTALWGELAEQGAFLLRLAEDAGGAGLGTSDAAVVYEELGRALVPGPLVGCDLGAEFVPGAAEGTDLVGILNVGATPLLVEHLDVLDHVLVFDGDEVRRISASELDAVPVAKPLDVLTPLHHVQSVPGGNVIASGDDARRLRRVGAVLTGALLTGIAAATCDLAVEYAKERVQFGVPIGKFQAVKHSLANMRVRADLARAAVYTAATSLDGADDDIDPELAVCTAKIASSSAALENAKHYIHVLGGIGFTWEVDAHLYLKRAWVLSTHFGAPEQHAERAAAIA